MLIHLKQLKEDIGGVLPFDYKLDISASEPAAAEPVSVRGQVVNRAGILLLSMEIEGTLHLVCDRCLAEFDRTFSVPFETMLADHIEGEENDDIVVYDNDELELDELAMPAFVLELPSKNLCREDCKGLCPHCGANLNESTCSCETRDIDPRLEALRALLDE